MRRLLAAAAILTASVVPTLASQTIAFSNLQPLGFCQIAVSTAVTLSSACANYPSNSNAIVVVVETAAVRWRDDGTAPTSSVGMFLDIGSTLTYMGDISKVQFVAVSGSPVIDVSFYSTR